MVFKLVDFDPFGVFLCFNEGSLFLNFNFRVFSRVIFFQIPKLKFKDLDNASPLLSEKTVSAHMSKTLILLLLPVTEYACSVCPYSLPQHLRLMQRDVKGGFPTMTALFMTQLVALQEYREFLIDNLLYSILCNPSHKLHTQLSLS